MARVYLSQGLCPSCGRDVPRTIHTQAGLQSEVYHCPTEGRFSTAASHTSLLEWAQERAPSIPMVPQVDWVA